MYTQVAEKWLVDQPGLRPLQREFLQEALAFYQEFAGQQGEDPEAQIEQAVALRRVGEIEDALSKHEQTERIYLQAIGLLNEIAEHPPGNPQRREELAAVHGRLARLYEIDGRIAEAIRHYSNALENYQALAIRHPDRAEYQARQAGCLTGLAGAHVARGSPQEAERLYSRARQLFEPLAARPETRAQAIKGLNTVHKDLGNIHFGARRFLGAEHEWRTAVKFSAQALADSPMSPKLKHGHAGTIEALATALACQGKLPEAESMFRDVIRIQEPLARDLPETSEFREALALSLRNLGELLNERGRSAEAEEALRRSIEISNGIITAAPRLIFRRVIIAGALIQLAACERKKGSIDASKGAPGRCAVAYTDRPGNQPAGSGTEPAQFGDRFVDEGNGPAKGRGRAGLEPDRSAEIKRQEGGKGQETVASVIAGPNIPISASARRSTRTTAA